MVKVIQILLQGYFSLAVVICNLGNLLRKTEEKLALIFATIKELRSLIVVKPCEIIRIDLGLFVKQVVVTIPQVEGSTGKQADRLGAKAGFGDSYLHDFDVNLLDSFLNHIIFSAEGMVQRALGLVALSSLHERNGINKIRKKWIKHSVFP